MPHRRACQYTPPNIHHNLHKVASTMKRTHSFAPARRAAVLFASALSLSFAGTAHAQAYPNKPIKFVVPFPAASATDNVGRIVAQAMGEMLGQSVAVENKAGANGILAAEQVKSSAGDGYTLLVTTSTTQAANTSLYKKLPYDPVKDFTPIGKIGIAGFALMVRPEFPAKDMAEFIAHAKANPGKLNYGHGSSGSLVSAAMLDQLAGIKTQPIAYKGIPPAVIDLLGGQIQYAFVDVGNAATQIEGGKLKGLGVTTAKRAGKTPTLAPIGDTVKGYDIEAWFGLMAPANLPPDVTKKLSDTLQAVLAKPDVRQRIAAVGIDLDPLDSAALAKLIDAEIKKWALWVKAANIQPE
jgi:tripartite-type tricarboxylate transporter receptor subunit TctC